MRSRLALALGAATRSPRSPAGRRWVVSSVVVAVIALSVLLPGSADAAAWKRCDSSSSGSPATISVRAMVCRDAAQLVNRLFRQYPHASSTPPGKTLRLHITGRTGGSPHLLTCSLRFGVNGGSRGAIRLTIRCRDSRGYGLNYIEQQNGG
jgi:hypothetical protein